MIRMVERRIAVADIEQVLTLGDVIEDYPNDTPFPSALYTGRTASGLPVHVVAARNTSEGSTIVITVYSPTPERWDATLRTRRPE
jgi:Domain of unknown function (DUF4258)